MLVTLQEYAELHGITFGTLRNAIYKGKFQPDKKINNRWYVDENKLWYTERNKKLKKYNSYSRLYNIWSAMKQRCYNPNHTAYYRYGGRGIKVCKAWKDNSQAFIEWAIDHGYADGLELDRINNDKNYQPSNCQWITHRDNIRKAPKGTVYKSDEARQMRLYLAMKRNGVDPDKYHVTNPYIK